MRSTWPAIYFLGMIYCRRDESTTAVFDYYLRLLRLAMFFHSSHILEVKSRVSRGVVSSNSAKCMS